jgi:hypothetical protein
MKVTSCVKILANRKRFDMSDENMPEIVKKKPGRPAKEAAATDPKRKKSDPYGDGAQA